MQFIDLIKLLKYSGLIKLAKVELLNELLEHFIVLIIMLIH